MLKRAAQSAAWAVRHHVGDAIRSSCPSELMVSTSQRCVGTLSSARGSASPQSWAASVKALLRDYNKLSKTKLSLLVVSTTAAGFVAASGETVDYKKLGWTCLGTFACSAAANTLNQVYEIRTDALMRRTMLRPLPAGRLSRAHALVFAGVMGLSGTATLVSQANGLTAALGVGNIALYAAVYTPLKQLHPINTWVGAVVGAIPPLMGWSAATGDLHPGAFALSLVLYFWQLPHFMALAWMGKEDYARGGYRMLSLMDVTGRRTAACALRNSLYLIPVGLAAVYFERVGAPFAYESLVVSGCMALTASQFYTYPTQQSARVLFRASLLHLPLLLVLYLLHRVPNDGLLDWSTAWARLQGDTAAVEAQLCAHGLPDLGHVLFPFTPPTIMGPCPHKAMCESDIAPAKAAVVVRPVGLAQEAER